MYYKEILCCFIFHAFINIVLSFDINENIHTIMILVMISINKNPFNIINFSKIWLCLVRESVPNMTSILEN